MPLSKDDRIAFSLSIVSADDTIKALTTAKAQLQTQLDKVAKLDQANKNLFDPVNAMVTAYQTEYNMLDGNLRTTIVEQDIQDSANKKLQNHFYPNDTTVTVPSLSATHNVWVKTKPFALTYIIGKNYIEAYGSTTKEGDLIQACLTLITSASSNTDIQNTTGQSCGATGTCSLPQYTTQAACTTGGGTWTPGPDLIANDPAIQTLKTNLVTAVNNLKTFLQTEAAGIVTNDPANQAINQAAINNINNVIIPALNTWLAYVDFNTAHGQTTCIGFNSYNSNLLAPTKLHSVQLAALQSALNTRNSFQTTRLGQLNTILGTVTQDLNTGEASGTGLYFKRYGLLNLRLDILAGSLMQLAGLQGSSGAQDAIISSTKSQKATYLSILPTSLLGSPGNGTTVVALADASMFQPGDAVWVIADQQDELQRSIKSVNGNSVTLNDIVPAKYNPGSKARLYKDLS
jgi:hypothetical protein